MSIGLKEHSAAALAVTARVAATAARALNRCRGLLSGLNGLRNLLGTTRLLEKTEHLLGKLAAAAATTGLPNIRGRQHNGSSGHTLNDSGTLLCKNDRLRHLFV
jgi:hypothetical protein